jgi:hypothetical protein
MTLKRIVLSLILLTALLGLAPQRAPRTMAAQTKPNILFIAVDDLNHWVKHLGRNKQVITPNIDRLARMGVTFSNAYSPRQLPYEKGAEELYDETKDPYEWTNVAGDKKHDKLKAELAKAFPKVNTPRGPRANGSGDGGGDARQRRRNNRPPGQNR